MKIIDLEIHLLGGKHDKECITYKTKKCFICNVEEATESHYLLSPSLHISNTCIGVCLKCKQLVVRKY